MLIRVNYKNSYLNNYLKKAFLSSILSDFGLGILNLKNAKHLKKNKIRINANSVASQKMVKFLHV